MQNWLQKGKSPEKKENSNAINVKVETYEPESETREDRLDRNLEGSVTNSDGNTTVKSGIKRERTNSLDDSLDGKLAKTTRTGYLKPD